jgi:hypothetical protein
MIFAGDRKVDKETNKDGAVTVSGAEMFSFFIICYDRMFFAGSNLTSSIL